jgi:hypothetical protein
VPLNLLDSFGKSGVKYDLLSLKADVIDTDYLSKYFVLSEFNPRFTSGKNSISINGSPFLKSGSEIIVECIDSQGNNLFIEMARSSDQSARTYAYKESTSFVLSIHVYNDTTDGVGKLIVYGTLSDGRNVRWTRNITIDKTLRNVSKVRFYSRPEIEVDSILVPVLSTNISTTLIIAQEFDATVHGLAVNPPKDTNLPTVNRRNIDVDYRLVVDVPVITAATDEGSACNSQMIGSTATVYLNKIQAPFSTQEVTPNPTTASFIIADVVNNKTLQLSDPYYYTDTKGNSVVTNVSSASVVISYPFVSYNNSTSSYLTTTIGGVTSTVKTSYADLLYKNLRTFSGFIARHKVYRQSLLSSADFTVVADEPLFINEILRDNLTQNKFYELLGRFYNDDHIARYWFTSSDAMALIHTPDVYIDSMQSFCADRSVFNGNVYFMVKNDSVQSARDATYVPYDAAQFLASSGSSYDSNFMALKSNVQYLLQIDAVIQKTEGDDARLEFYFTSSVPDATKDPNFTAKYGIKLATLTADRTGVTKNFDGEVSIYTPTSDLYGTLVVVPYNCNAYFKNISLRVYGDDGFSPDVFETRIPWPISVAGESFEIRAELFDINHNLVYSDLRVLQSFDQAGNSLVPFIPNGGGNIVPGTTDMYISGNLFVSKSVEIRTGSLVLDHGNILVPQMSPRTQTNAVVSASRMLWVRGDGSNIGQLAYGNVVEIYHDNKHLTVVTSSLSLGATTVLARQSLATAFDSNSGRRVYFAGGIKQVENGPLS